MPATSEEVASAGWATPNVTETWSSLGEGSFPPAAKPAASEPAPEENTEFAQHQEKVDSETSADPVSGPPDATNAWGTSAPAPASNNAWSNNSDPGKLVAGLGLG